MIEDDLRNRLRASMRTDVQDPWEDARKFIASWFGLGDTRAQIEDYALTKGHSPADIRGLKAIDMLLASPDNDDSLVQLVLWVANAPLPLADGAHARAWLREVLDWMGPLRGYHPDQESTTSP